MPIFARRCLQRRPLKIYGTGEQTRSFTAVADIVAANLLASDSTTPSGQSFTCASGVAVSIRPEVPGLDPALVPAGLDLARAVLRGQRSLGSGGHDSKV